MPSPEKFRDTLNDFNVEKDVRDAIYEGYDRIVSKTSKKEKSAFFRQAIEIMNERLPKDKVQEILEANACCRSGAREKCSKEFARINAHRSIEERLKLISLRPYMNMGKASLLDDGTILVNGVFYQPGDRYECACPTVSRVKRDYAIPREYCFCCGGHFKYHYEIMLNVKLDLVEIVSSPHDTNGEMPCAFRYKIIG